MANPPEQIQSELETFREEWRAEVTARSRNTTENSGAGTSHQGQGQQAQRGSPPSRPVDISSLESRRSVDAPLPRTAPQNVAHIEEEEDLGRGQTFELTEANRPPGVERPPEDVAKAGAAVGGSKERNTTAIEFYEQAVDKETVGKLGDSLQLYRKAFRMDSRVDVAYRDKHFPGRWKQTQPNPSNAPVTVPNTAHHSSDVPVLSLPDLIASFAGLNIQPCPPAVEGAPALPCPLADLPDEILVLVLCDLAIMDVGDFVRLSQVCKRLAFLVATENQIWRRVCVGSEFGFSAMVHHWRHDVSWTVLVGGKDVDDGLVPLEEVEKRWQDESLAATNALIHSVYSSSWLQMFRRRARIRFNGCYISTVNYIRQGQASQHSHISWNSPIHVVTYYRYLRFYRDGTAISLLTTTEPAEVVHSISKRVMLQHQGGAAPHLPSAFMKSALKGRWRLSGAADRLAAADTADTIDRIDREGDVLVETEGIGPKYMHRMELSLKSSARATKNRNNKLVWKGFWCYNRLTDDWAEFGLKNDKPFFFSRVKSYGVLGENE